MDFQKLLQNKTLLFSIVGGAILLVIIFVIIGFSKPQVGSNEKTVDPDEDKKIDGVVELVTSDNLGKIILSNAELFDIKIILCTKWII